MLSLLYRLCRKTNKCFPSVSIEESADLGIIISRLEVIEPGLDIVELAMNPKNALISTSPEAMESVDSMALFVYDIFNWSILDI